MNKMHEKANYFIRSDNDEFYHWAVQDRIKDEKLRSLLKKNPQCNTVFDAYELEYKLEKLWNARALVHLEYQIIEEKRHFPIDKSCNVRVRQVL
jgi:hypothetical protein